MSGKPRILIVDDDPMMARTVSDIIRLKGHQAETAYSGPEALGKVGREAYDCVLSDIKMPGLDGVELYRAIKARQPDLPVVLMTAYAHDELVREGLEEGVIAVLPKPLDLDLLLDFVVSLRGERSVVIVDDDPQFCRTLGDILRAQGYAVRQVTDPRAAVEQLEVKEQVVLLDMKLDGLSGLDVLRKIRERHPHLPVILVTGYREEMAPAIEAALALSAYACFYKPFQIENLLQVLTEIRHRGLGSTLGRPVEKK
jgi:two-component system response regulator HydG